MNTDPNIDEIWHIFNTLSLQLNVMRKCFEKQMFGEAKLLDISAEAHAADSLWQHAVRCVHNGHCMYSSQHSHNPSDSETEFQKCKATRFSS